MTTVISKRELWSKGLEKFEKTVNQYGKSISKETLESIVALNLLDIDAKEKYDFPLHRRVNYPRIVISSKRGTKTSRSKGKAVLARDLQKVWELLKKYYETHSSEHGTRLILADTYSTQTYLISQGAIFQDIRSPKKQEEKLEEYQKEMESFGKFLKKRFLNKC